MNDLPPLAKRVMIETEEGSILFAKRVNRADGQGVHWIDDQSCPVRSPVVAWKEVVSLDENKA